MTDGGRRTGEAGSAYPELEVGSRGRRGGEKESRAQGLYDRSEKLAYVVESVWW